MTIYLQTLANNVNNHQQQQQQYDSKRWTKTTKICWYVRIYSSLLQPERIRLRDSHYKNALHYCAAHSGDLVAAASIAVAAPELLESADEDGFTPLHLAVIQGNLAMVNLLLANKADVNAVDKEGHSVVHWATVCGEVGALRSVLAAGANVTTPDINGGSPLHYAAQMCGASYEGKLSQTNSSKLALEILGILLAHPQCSVDVQDKDGRQPLLWAASAGSAKAVIALVKAGARVESADKDGLTALHCAASRGHTECIDTLISLCGAPTDLIDTNGCTALHYAVTLGHADATSRLLDFEADPNRQDRKGRTPAHCGCAKGQFETVKLLKERNANLWLRNAKGDLPLHEAATSGRRELVEWLLEQRPKQVNTTSNDGRSMLHIAAHNDYTDMCKMLLDYGADVNAVYRNSKGVVITPLDCSLQKGHRSTAKFLQSHGGLPAGKLRLAARRSNPFTNTSVEVIKPLKYAEKEEIHDLTNSKKYVVYLKRSDSEAGEEANCSCTEQTYRREQRYAHTCRRHQRHKRHHLRRRTSSCGDSLEFNDDCSNICRSKSNIEIRRRKSRERYSSSSEWEAEDDEEDSCENCCYHKRRKQRVIQRKRSTPSKKSRNSQDPEDKDKSEDKEEEKSSSKPSSQEKEDKKEADKDVENKANVPDVVDAAKSRPNSTTKSQEALTDKDAIPSTPQTAKEGTFIKTPPETPQTSKESTSLEAPIGSAAVELTDEEEQTQVTMENIQAEVQVHRAADDMESKEQEDKTEVEKQEQIQGEETKKEEDVKEEQLSKEQTKSLETTSSSANKEAEPRKEDVTEAQNEKNELEEEGKELKEEEGDSLDIKDSMETVIEVKQKLEETKDSEAQITNEPKQETKVDDTKQETKAETLPKSSEDDRETKTVTEKTEAALANENKSTEITSKTTTPPPATTATSVETKPNEDKKPTDEAKPKAEKRASISQENINAAAKSSENRSENIATKSSTPQAEREQESRRSFTLLPSDSAEDEMEMESEEPERKSSFQVLKSDESVLEVEESPSPREDHDLSDNTVFKVLTEPLTSPLYEVDSSKSEALMGRASQELDEDVEQERNYRIEDAAASPYDYSTGRKRRLKKRVKSGVKTRGGSNWKRAEGEVGEMQQNTRDQDSGFEPSPRTMKSKIPTPRNVYTAHIPRRPLYTTLDGRSCSSRLENRKLGDKGACDMSAVTRSIQRNIRRYYMERKIFQHLLELKSLQIRSNKLNEAVLVKRAVDDYHKSCAALGGETGTRLRRYNFSEYTFKNFELFLYETLKALQKPGTYNFQNINEVYEEAERRLSPDYNAYEKALQCTTRTHRCLHAAHAYTGIPCAAYIPMMNHHTMPKFGFGPYKKTGVGSFYLPKILTTGTACNGKVALELSHGKSKQLISLPSEKLDSNKRYFVTFTVKETDKQQQQGASANGCDSKTGTSAVNCTSASEDK
ncbi:inversin [Lucilia sericata]|uniref:inversin n=1 Tax=Lucilia sericata TaxID=13632 RepID=UPI0018A80DD2|nr:inversin [Lucilia sericata]